MRPSSDPREDWRPRRAEPFYDHHARPNADAIYHVDRAAQALAPYAITSIRAPHMPSPGENQPADSGGFQRRPASRSSSPMGQDPRHVDACHARYPRGEGVSMSPPPYDAASSPAARHQLQQHDSWSMERHHNHSNASHRSRSRQRDLLPAFSTLPRAAGKPPARAPRQPRSRVASEPADLYATDSPMRVGLLKRSLSDYVSSHSPSFRGPSGTEIVDYEAGYRSPFFDEGSNVSMSDSSPGNSPRVPYQCSAGRAKAGATRPTTHVKESRYLREIDRRIILSRITKGEKQSALAKEYGVSRSTVCNLNKHRDVVMSRKGENPLSRHPKKTRRYRANAVANSTASSKDSDEDIEPTSSSLDFFSFDTRTVIEVESRAVALLQTKIHNRETPTVDFQRCSSRLMRLLLEETLAILNAGSTADSNATTGACDADEVKPAEPASPAATVARSLVGVSMESHGTAMLNSFCHLEPASPTGSIRAPSSGTSSSLELHGAGLPKNLSSYNVLLLDVVSASGDLVCAAIERLLARSTDPANVSLVTLFVSAEVIALVQYAYPSVRIFCTGVDPQLHHRFDSAQASSSRAFLERFHESLR